MAKKKKYDPSLFVRVKPMKQCPKCELNGRCPFQRILVSRNRKKAYVYWPESTRAKKTNKAKCFVFEGRIYFKLVGDKNADNH